MKKLHSTIRISELADISLRIGDFYKKETALSEDNFLKSLFAEIGEKTSEISVAMKKETAYSQLENADDLRDETIKNLYAILNGYKAMRNPDIKASAEYLLTIFEKYGLKIIRESYASESAHIESMLMDFSSEDAKKYIAKLSEVAETIAELRERQTAFHTERMTYEKSLSESKNMPSASSLKKPLLDLINQKLVSFLTAMKDIEAYKNFYAVIEQIIKDANELTARRKKSGNEKGNN